MRLHRWEVIHRNAAGTVLGSQRFVFERSARAYMRWQDDTAIGDLPFLTPLPEGHSRLYTSELRRVSR